MALSLCLCQLPAAVEYVQSNSVNLDENKFPRLASRFDWAPQAYKELIEALCFPTDLETIERALVETGYLMFSGVRELIISLLQSIQRIFL